MFKPIFKAYSSSLLGVFSGLITQLVFIRELAHIVSTKEFALYAFIFQITTYLNILQLGLDFATSREIASKLGSGDPVGANYSYLFIRRFNNKICIAGFAFVAIVATLFFNGIGISSSFDYVMAAKLVITFGAALFISFLSNPNMVALIGSNKQSVVNVNNVLITILTTVSAFILLKSTKLGIYSMPLSLLVFNSINFVLLKYKAFRTCKSWLVNDDSISVPKGYNKSLLKFSVISTIGGLAWTIEATSDVFILNSIGLLHLVGIYVIWWRFPQMFFDLATRLSSSAFPGLTTTYAFSKADGISLFSRLLIISSSIAFIIFIGTAIWLPSFINIWVGPQFLYDSNWLSFLIGALIFLRIIGNCFGMFVLSTGNVKLTTTVSWLQAIVKVGLGLILTNEFGLVGLLLASICGALIQNIVLGFYLLKNNSLKGNLVILIICGLCTPLVLTFFKFHIYDTLSSFTKGTVITLIASSLLWSMYLIIGKLHKKLGFNLSKFSLSKS